MEKLTFQTEDGAVDFYVLEQTRFNGKNYLLENTDDETAELLENVRLGKTNLEGSES